MFSKELNEMLAEMSDLHQVMVQDEQIAKETLQFIEQRFDNNCSNAWLYTDTNFPATNFWYDWLLEKMDNLEYIDEIIICHEEEDDNRVEVIFN